MILIGETKSNFKLEFTGCFLQLSQKDAELQMAVQNSVEANKVKLLHEQIQDRLRHYEAQAQLVETLQKELQSARVKLVKRPSHTR